jgi:uncharacterized membrane protein YczE
VTVTLAARPDSPLARRLGTLLAGLVLVGTGVALTITAEIGVAPYDVLSTGIAATFGIEIGLAAMILPCIFAGLGWALGGRVGVGTVLSVLLVGPILGVVLEALPEVESLWVRVPMFFLGFAMISAGITGAVIAEIGPGPAEVLMLAIHAKGFELARTRTAIELTSVAIGWALGGQVGVGTAIIALSIGPTLRSMLRWSGYRATGPDDKVICAEPGA